MRLSILAVILLFLVVLGIACSGSQNTSGGSTYMPSTPTYAPYNPEDYTNNDWPSPEPTATPTPTPTPSPTPSPSPSVSPSPSPSEEVMA